jgi:hypothetical protein
MLGTLAKWLRIYGFDTYFANSEIDDNKLLEISEKEKRVLITRDKELAFRAKSRNLEFILLRSIDLDEQLKVVFKNYKINKDLFLTRCLLCNNKLIDIKKEEVIDKVPSRVFENNDDFFYCNKCKKIYWKGTHYENMINKIS